jgi:hypothetical protein
MWGRAEVEHLARELAILDVHDLRVIVGIGDHDPTSGAHDADHLRKRLFRALEVLEDAVGPSAVERPVGEGKHVRIGDAHVAQPSPARLLDHRCRAVDARDNDAEAGLEGTSIVSGARPHLQVAAAGDRPKKHGDPLLVGGVGRLGAHAIEHSDPRGRAVLRIDGRERVLVPLGH